MARQTLIRAYKREHLVIQLHYDDGAESPRDSECNLGTMLYTSSRHTLGDRQASAEEIEGICESDDYYWLPVYAYIHSGIALSTGPFGCRWDSGQCGIIYVSKADVAKEFKDWKPSPEKPNETLGELIERCLKGEVETYAHYVAGECCGYIIGELDPDVDIEEGRDDIEGDLSELESCWGFYSDDDALQAAEDAVAYLLADAKAKADFAGPQPMWEI